MSPYCVLQLTKFSLPSGEKFCMVGNTDNSSDSNVDLGQDGKFFLPAWSVTFLQNGNMEVFNTAKANDKGKDGQPNKLSWFWTSEQMEDTLKGEGKFEKIRLLDQKETTVDASDYLWYMTSHGLHAYVNGKLMGNFQANNSSSNPMGNKVDGDDYSFVFEKPTILKPGSNVISLLSATVGFAAEVVLQV
ncbi:hypothetical protein Pint_13545 [Pistacia integerrima]|uniref:Uncharacterized protein n=1 Tax=Pistacia integerrima TaxID=434235 RepID=A0ACC0Y5P5_9ROSI|nr:hypothetical protein Pint_13545 [Pistacia integerrima]